MNCSWCHKPVADNEIYFGDIDRPKHTECELLLLEAKVAKQTLDIFEAKELLRDPCCDPMASEKAQNLLAEYRRLNRLALDKLDKGNRFRLMFGQPLLEE